MSEDLVHTLGYVFSVFIITLFSMILHELMHGFVALRLGDDTAKYSGRLSLNPLKHIDPVMTIIVPIVLALMGGPIFGGAKPVPINTRKLKYNEWGFALVAIAGPLTNFVLALLFFLVGYWTGALSAQGGAVMYAPGNFWSMFMMLGVSVNIGFMLFNIIPIPPLDGSRVLYAIAPEGGIRRFMEQIEHYGIFVIYFCLLFFGTALSFYMSGAMEAILRLFTMLVGA
ncbi:site-2 protease family protein [Candidatus Saccharibacteria bacterium]|nr:site-2 protease family protein [Candidatus Saccharibacteria bacterium]MBP5656677.1 site-2 protease family protein [Candidatus Saccharibacteria bacterium]